MSAQHGFVFTCDSPDGCIAHAMVSGDDVAVARDNLHEALGWHSAAGGDLCPEHVDQRPVAGP